MPILDGDVAAGSKPDAVRSQREHFPQLGGSRYRHSAEAGDNELRREDGLDSNVGSRFQVLDKSLAVAVPTVAGEVGDILSCDLGHSCRGSSQSNDELLVRRREEFLVLTIKVTEHTNDDTLLCSDIGVVLCGSLGHVGVQDIGGEEKCEETGWHNFEDELNEREEYSLANIQRDEPTRQRAHQKRSR